MVKNNWLFREGRFSLKKGFSPVRFRLKSPKRENKSMNFVEKRFLKKHEKRRKTKKTSESRWFSGSNLFRPLSREAPTRIELVLKILQTSALPLGYGAVCIYRRSEKTKQANCPTGRGIIQDSYANGNNFF